MSELLYYKLKELVNFHLASVSPPQATQQESRLAGLIQFLGNAELGPSDSFILTLQGMISPIALPSDQQRLTVNILKLTLEGLKDAECIIDHYFRQQRPVGYHNLMYVDTALTILNWLYHEAVNKQQVVVKPDNFLEAWGRTSHPTYSGPRCGLTSDSYKNSIPPKELEKTLTSLIAILEAFNKSLKTHFAQQAVAQNNSLNTGSNAGEAINPPQLHTVSTLPLPNENKPSQAVRSPATPMIAVKTSSIFGWLFNWLPRRSSFTSGTSVSGTSVSGTSVSGTSIEEKPALPQVPVPAVLPTPPISSKKPNPSLVCPLTLKIMKDPVLDCNGHSYERKAIEDWFKNNDASPVTKKKLSSKSLVPNIALRYIAEADQEKPLDARAFECPISLEMMEDPVVAADGYTYERAAIENWFKTSSISPCTGKKLDDKSLLPNHALKACITKFKNDLEQPVAVTPDRKKLKI